MSLDEQTPRERALTELFQRLPSEAPPLGFRDAVMARIARERARRWERALVLAAAVAIPNLLFLLWQVLDSGEELSRAGASLMDALLGMEQWDAGTSVYVDGIVLLAVALLGLTALLVTQVLVAHDRGRLRPT